MQETTYDCGKEVVRLGPLSEMQLAALEDLKDPHVQSVRITKFTKETMAETLARLEQKIVKQLQADSEAG